MPRYNTQVIAVRAPLCWTLGIVTALGAGLLLMRPATPAPSAPAIEIPVVARTPVRIQQTQHEPRLCMPAKITAVVIRGQFTAKDTESFAISFSGAQGQYTAMTDKRGYFEVRIPRSDFEGDLCDLPITDRDFSDDQMTLKYRIDVEYGDLTQRDL